MKSAVASIVRNESDIIEVFIRYHLRVFDHIFLVLHQSKDGTKDIVDQLIKEGLPITYKVSNVVFHNQKNEMNKLLSEIRKNNKPQVLMPLDADEFIVGDLKRAAHELPGPNCTLALSWFNYAPTNLDVYDNNILKTITHRNAKVNLAQHKVLIPGPLIDMGGYVKEGSHEVYKDEKVCKLIQSQIAHIAHFPVRSNNQIKKKALVNWISKCANPENRGLAPDWSHWKLLFDLAKKNSEISLVQLQRLALGYTEDHIGFSFELVYDPLNVEGVLVQYPIDDNKYDPVEALADAAEILSIEFSKVASV